MRTRGGVFTARRPFRLRLLILTCLLSLLPACSPVKDQRTDLDMSLGQSSWAEFSGRSALADTKSGPYNMILNVRYASPERSQRFSAYFWGNAGQTPYPVRLDVQGALGAVAAKLFENAESFVLYDTENNAAHVTRGSSNALLQIGLPLPVSLGDLSLLLGGRYQDFFLPGQNSDMPRLIASSLDRRSTFNISTGPRAGLLTLDDQGRPVLWAEPDDNGWRFELSYLEGVYKDALPGPQRVIVSHPRGYSINLLVKNYNPQPRAYSPEQLNLIIPADATIKNS